MQRARLVADQAIEKLAELPSGVITDALRRFADQVVERQG